LTEYVAVVLMTVIVNADTPEEAATRAQLPFNLGLVPNMAKIAINHVREAREGDHDPIDWDKVRASPGWQKYNIDDSSTT
jgi:hypothetical protein